MSLPFNAEHHLFVAGVEHQHRMERAERERLVAAHGAPSGLIARLSHLSGEVGTGLGRARAMLLRPRGVRHIPVGDEAGAIPPA